MFYYFVRKAVKSDGTTICDNTILTRKGMLELAELDASFTLPAFFQNKKELEDFMNKERFFNVYLAQEFNGTKVGLHIVITTMSKAPKNTKDISEQEVVIADYGRVLNTEGMSEEHAKKVTYYQAATTLAYVVLKHGYKNINLFTNLTYSVFDFISSKLNEVDVNYEYNLHKYGFTEADLKFSSFIQRLQQYPSAQKVIVHSANNSKNSMHMTLARGLANERIGGQLPPNYGPILAFLA